MCGSSGRVCGPVCRQMFFQSIGHPIGVNAHYTHLLNLCTSVEQQQQPPPEEEVVEEAADEEPPRKRLGTAPFGSPELKVARTRLRTTAAIDEKSITSSGVTTTRGGGGRGRRRSAAAEEEEGEQPQQPKAGGRRRSGRASQTPSKPAGGKRGKTAAAAPVEEGCVKSLHCRHPLLFEYNCLTLSPFVSSSINRRFASPEPAARGTRRSSRLVR